MARCPVTSGKAGSILNISVINMLSRKRHMLGFMKVGEMCGCGCGGHCSIYSMMRVAAFQIQCLTDGAIPEWKHDGSDWEPHERPTTKFPFKSALVLIKGDWAEFAKSMGLTGWGNVHDCCPICPCSKDGLDIVDANFSDKCGLVWNDRHEEEYEASCASRETTVLVDTEAKRATIWTLLQPVKKKGIIMQAALPLLGLLEGDRLDPSPECLIPLEFDKTPVPFLAVFWRTRYDCMNRKLGSVVHRSPLFSAALGTSPARSLALDTMHTVHLGCMQRYVSTVAHRIVYANPWRAPPLGVWSRLESDLIVYYERELVPYENRVNTLNERMFPGDSSECFGGAKVKLKASETVQFLKFMVITLKEHGDCGIPHHKHLVAAGDALIAWMHVYHSARARPSPGEYQLLRDNCVRFLVNCNLAEIHFVPKFHLFGHLTKRTHWALQQYEQAPRRER